MEVNANFTDKALRDFELIQRARNANDQSAYAKLLDYYRDSIYFMLLKMTHNSSDAEDLTIEAFGKAFKNIEQYTPDYAFSTWLFKIATNNCIDFIRKKKIQTLSIDDQDEDSAYQSVSNKINDKERNPEESIINDEKIATMREVVKKLKPHYRILIEMRYFQEFSYEEIAAELNLPMGTVKAKLFRARDLMLNIIDKNHSGLRK